MPLSLSEVVDYFAYGLKEADAEKPEPQDDRSYRPGIGPLDEPVATELALDQLRVADDWENAETEKSYPSDGRMHCDLFIPKEWAIEVKLLRPFGNNGKEMEHWSENVLHPYESSKTKSSIGDALKLLNSEFAERKAVLIYGFEHDPPEISLETTIEAFELISEDVRGINLSPRAEAKEKNLVHSVHEQVRTYGWEILG